MFISIWSHAERYLSSRTASAGLLHKSDGVIVVMLAGQMKKCLTSCGVMPYSAQTLGLDSAFVGTQDFII